MGLVHDCKDASPAANELMSGDLVDLEPFRWLRDVEKDVEERRLGGEGVEHVLGDVGRKVLWYVVDVVGVSAWFAAENGDARFGVASGHVGRGVEVQELAMKGPTIFGTAEAGSGPTSRILKGPIQVKDSLVLRTMASVPFLAPWRMVTTEL